METPDDPTAKAVAKAIRDANIDSRLDSHERRLNMINGSQAEMVRVQKLMQDSLDRLEGKFETSIAVAKAVADRGVSSRSFYLTCAGMVISVGAILAGTGHV